MTQRQWIKEFEERFAHIAHKGVQCDTITLENLKDFITLVEDKARARLLEEVEGMRKAVGKNVQDNLMINGKTYPVKEELNGVIGFIYNSALDEVIKKIKSL